MMLLQLKQHEGPLLSHLCWSAAAPTWPQQPECCWSQGAPYHLSCHHAPLHPQQLLLLCRHHYHHHRHCICQHLQVAAACYGPDPVPVVEAAVLLPWSAALLLLLLAACQLSLGA